MGTEASSQGRGILVGGRYRLGRPLGSGGMGVVFNAIDERLGREVAVKVVRGAHLKDPDTVARFEREAMLAGKLGHPNIVGVTDQGRTDDGFPYVVMERLEGRTLEARIEADGPLPVQDAIDIHVQLLDALACAHEAGVLHRDVKPANVFLASLATGTQLVKLLDFGIAAAASGGRKLTQDGAVVGSPVYLAPERFRGQPARAESDLYAVGVSLFESLTGRVPLDAEQGVTLQHRVFNDKPESLDRLRADVPAPLARLVDRALSKAPEERHATARQMREALRAIVVSTASLPAPEPVQSADVSRSVRTVMGIGDPGARASVAGLARAEPALVDVANTIRDLPLAVDARDVPADPSPAWHAPAGAARADQSRAAQVRAPTEILTARPSPRPPIPLVVAGLILALVSVGLGMAGAFYQFSTREVVAVAPGPATPAAANPVAVDPAAANPAAVVPAPVTPVTVAPVPVGVVAPPAGSVVPVPSEAAPSAVAAPIAPSAAPPSSAVHPEGRPAGATASPGSATHGSATHGGATHGSATHGGATLGGAAAPTAPSTGPSTETTPATGETPDRRPRTRAGSDGLIEPNW